MVRTLVIGLLLSFGMFGVAQAAQIYTWVDENGQKHYSATPPKDGKSKAESLTVRAPQSTGTSEQSNKAKEDALNNLGDKVDENNDARKENDADVAKRNDEMTQDACMKSQERLKALRTTPRLYTKKENGEHHWYTDEEKKQLIKEATREAKEFCKPKAS